MTSDLAIRDSQTFWDDKQVAVLRQIGVENATEGDLQVFFHQCKRTGLDPFVRQIHMIGRNTKNPRTNQWETKYTIQTGIDGFRLIGRRAADRNKETLEVSNTEWCGANGRWVDVWLATGPPAAARVAIIRNGGRFPAVALFSEYVQHTKNGDVNHMWRSRPAGQLEKCAEALAWRRAFPQDLSGIYTEDEMGQADAHPQVPQTQIESAAPEPNLINQGQLAKLKILLGELNMDRDRGLDLYERVIGRRVESSKELTKAEASQVIDALVQAKAEGVQPDTGEVLDADVVPQEPEAEALL